MNSVIGQTVFFNRTYNYKNKSEAFGSIYKNYSDSSYLIEAYEGASQPSSDSAYFTTGFGFMMIRKNGDIDTAHKLNIFYLPYCSISAIPILNMDSDSNLIYWQFSFRGRNVGDTFIRVNYIGCYNLRGDNLWLRKLNVEIDSSDISSALKMNNYIYGFGTPNGYWASGVQIAKFDLSGNRLFGKMYDTKLAPCNINKIGTNRLISVGQHYYYNWNSALDSKPWYMITDTTGEIIFEKRFKDSLISDIRMDGIYKFSPNQVLVTGYRLVSGGNDKNVFLYFMDTLGQIYREENFPLTFNISDLTVLENKDLVCVGNNEKDGFGIGKIIKFDTTGVIKWQREYYYSNYESDFVKIDRSFNNGFIMSGTAIDTTHPTANQDAWLVVTDSFGCVTPGCHLKDYVQEISKEKINYLEVSPNPADGYIRCVLHADLKLSDCELLLLDGNGKELSRQCPDKNESELNLSSYPNGLYYVMLLRNSRLLASSKILKQ